MKAITIALIVLGVITAGHLVGPFPKTRRSLRGRRCRKVIVVPPPVCPDISPPTPVPEKLKTPKPSKSFSEKLINTSIKDLLKTLIMTIVSLVAKMLFEKRTFQTKVIRFVASFLRLIMTIGGYAATDVLSVCILATIKSTFTHLLYKVLLVRSYRTILKHNFKYLLSLGITKINTNKSETRQPWSINHFFNHTIIGKCSAILNEIFFGQANTKSKTLAKRTITRKQSSEFPNKQSGPSAIQRKKSERIFEDPDFSTKDKKARSISLESNKRENVTVVAQCSDPSEIAARKSRLAENLSITAKQPHSHFTNYQFKKPL
jgi:hypothetical protein